MQDKAALYRQLLMRHFGDNSSNCLFCYDNPDSYIVRGSPKEHSFHLPFRYEIVDRLVISYVQDGAVIIEKMFDKDMKLYNFKQIANKYVLYWTLTEEDTFMFEVGVPVQIQLKAAFKDTGKVITSQVYTIDVYESITPEVFLSESPTYYALNCRISGQNIKIHSNLQTIQNSHGLYRCRFFFDSTWNGFAKSVLFKDEYNHNISIDLLETRDNMFECTLPIDVIRNIGKVYIGIAGVYSSADTFIAKPTVWSDPIRIPKSCLETGEELNMMKERKSKLVIYYGAINEADKATVAQLTPMAITRQELLANGFKWSKYKLDNQYHVVAIPKSLQVVVDKIIQEAFTVKPTTHEDADYTYYYFSSKATGVFTSQYYFKEAK